MRDISPTGRGDDRARRLTLSKERRGAGLSDSEFARLRHEYITRDWTFISPNTQFIKIAKPLDIPKKRGMLDSLFPIGIASIWPVFLMMILGSAGLLCVLSLAKLIIDVWS